MGYWSLVLDRVYLQTGCLQGPDGRFAARSGTLNDNIDLLDPMVLDLLCDLLGSHLGRERGGLSCPLEAHITS